MKLKVYSLYDSKAEAYLRPMFMPTKGIALRTIVDELENPNNNLSKHAADYTLFELGEFDDETGTITMHPNKINIGCLIEYTKDFENSWKSENNIRDIQELKTSNEKGKDQGGKRGLDRKRTDSEITNTLAW